MHPCFTHFLLIPLLVLAVSPASAMEIVWTRMTGQYPVESAPLVADVDQDGAPEVVAVNRMGQVMRWSLGGENLAAGQDGTVFQLPEGVWSSSPTLATGPEGSRMLLGSLEGLVVALDKRLDRVAWQHQLAGPTTFARAVPAMLPISQGQSFCFGDHTGTVTCLDVNGKLLWKTELKKGKCTAELKALVVDGRDPILLAPCGSSLVALDPGGSIRWSQDLGGQILVRPETVVVDGKTAVVCGGGRLVALDPASGEVLWSRRLDGEVDSSLAVLPVAPGRSLLLYLGLWGNLSALETTGKPAWQALFRSKSRSRPLVGDWDGDGHAEILVSAYNQHLYEFSDRGTLRDDLRLSGSINASPVFIQESGQSHPDVLLVTAAQLAYRIRPGAPRSPYGATGQPEGVTLALPDGQRSVVVENPNGALVRAHVSSRTEQAGVAIRGTVTARSRLELALPEGAGDFQATVEDIQGRVLAELAGDTIPPPVDAPSPAQEAVRVWAASAYASFDETRLVPERPERGVVEIRQLYQNEVDQAALVVASTWKGPLRARVRVSALATADKSPFGGRLTLREVVSTGTVNGECAADALPALGDAGLVTLLPHRAAKIWVSVDAQGAKPGVYEGQITVESLSGSAAASTLPIRVEVLRLDLGKAFPLALCTWDYIPNAWFPERPEAVLDDMARHGVNVWPRADCIPPARCESDGRLVVDWTKLDATLVRLKGRGQILFQIGTPPIEFAAPPSPEAKHQAELKYLRAWRDHLQQCGWDYADYAFYPLDEPGLDHGKNLPILLSAATLFREADPKFRIYTDPVPGLCWDDFQRLEPLIDVWCPNMRLASGQLSGDPRMKQILGGKKTAWSYECVSQVKSLSPLRYNRANAWRAKFFGLSGIGFWTFSTTDVDHWLPGKTVNDEYALVYPGALPVPSVRWEAVRDGLEDIAAMAVLEQAIADRQRDGTKADLVRQAEDALRIARVDILEMSDEAFVESRDFLRNGDRRLWHTGTDVEIYPRHRARFAQLTEALNGSGERDR